MDLPQKYKRRNRDFRRNDDVCTGIKCEKSPNGANTITSDKNDRNRHILKSEDVLTDFQNDKWSIGYMLGKGGNGQVYAASKMSENEGCYSKYRYAIKIVSIRKMIIY